MKLDILIFSAHPDDAELACGGTILKHIAEGYKVGIVDLTHGELGTRGTPEIRDQEAQAAAQILGLSARVNIGLRDGFFTTSEAECLAVIQEIRRYQPEIIICNATSDRHPDHKRGQELVVKAGFLSGLRKIETLSAGLSQQAWRAKKCFSYVQDQYIKPDFIVDVTQYWEQKQIAIKAYKSQFWNPESDEPASYISSEDFMDFIESRSREMGHAIGAKHGEGFVKHQQMQISNIFDLL